MPGEHVGIVSNKDAVVGDFGKDTDRLDFLESRKIDIYYCDITKERKVPYFLAGDKMANPIGKGATLRGAIDDAMRKIGCSGGPGLPAHRHA